ncbi:hypothetical protein BDW60DRAFT_116960 [Aspergillus nidulans var. acristatus]
MDNNCCVSPTPIPHRSHGKYMDTGKLVLLLRKQYGASNFRIDLQRDQYMVYINERTSRNSYLTDAEIEDCRCQC